MQQPLPSVLQTASSWRGGREARCFRASAQAWRCISMAASDLGPKALNVAALNDLCHLCPTWTQAGCALNAVSGIKARSKRATPAAAETARAAQ